MAGPPATSVHPRIAYQFGWDNNRRGEAIGQRERFCKKNKQDAKAGLLSRSTHGIKGPRRLADVSGLVATVNMKIKRKIGRDTRKLGPPKLPEAERQTALSLFQQNRLNEAHAVCQRLAGNYRSDPDILMMLGIINVKAGLLPQAASCFQKWIDLQPNNAWAHYYLGVVHLNFGDTLRAKQCFEKAVQRKSDFAEAYSNLGYVLIQAGDEEGGVASFNKALAINPYNAEALVGVIKHEAQKGKFADAYERLMPILQRGIPNVNVMKIYAELSMELKREESAIGLLEKFLQTSMDNTVKQACCFCLGEIYDKLADYDRAFMHYKKANELSKYPSNLGMHITAIHSLKKIFTREVLRSLPRPSVVTAKPVFIVGMPRSGTSLVEQILASHPDIHGGGELVFIGEIANTLPAKLNSNIPYPACLPRITQKIIDESVAGYMKLVDNMAGGARKFTDKMPHNFLNLGLIQLLFPGARVIHCTRDPRDTCLSIYFHAFAAQHSYSYFLEDIGTYYRHYESLMRHWQAELDLPILTVPYEELIKNRSEHIANMLEFLGMPWSDSCEKFYESDRLVITPSFAQVRKPLHDKSVARWKHYEDYLGPLLRGLENRVA